MQPIYLTLKENLNLMIIPDSDAHLDGHPVLTYSYSIYDMDNTTTSFVDKESKLHLEEQDDPAYLGVIIYEQPGNKITYRPDGERELTVEEVEMIIEKITKYRDTPSMWSI